MFASNNGHMKIIGKCQIPLLDMMTRNIIIMILMKMLMKNGSKKRWMGQDIFNKKKKKTVKSPRNVLRRTAPNNAISPHCQKDA